MASITPLERPSVFAHVIVVSNNEAIAPDKQTIFQDFDGGKKFTVGIP
jgi:hypothetical protein